MAENPTREELGKKIKELEKIFDLSMDMIGSGSLKGYFTRINSAFEHILGYTKEELLKKPFISFVHDEDVEKTKKAIADAASGKKNLYIENRYKCKDGSYKWIEWKVISIKEENGFIAVGRETSERKKAEKELRAEKRIAKQYLDIAGVMFIAIDREQKVRMVNKKGCEILGYEEHEIIGKNWFDHFIKAENTEEIKRIFNQILSGNIEPFKHHENEILTKQGEKKIILWNNSVIKEESGRIIGTLSSGEDITERKQAEEALKESERWHRNLMDNLSDGIFETDDRGNITYTNKITESVVGVALKDIIGKPFLPLFDKKSQATAIDVYLRTLNGESPEYELKFKNGRIASFKNKPLKNKHGKIIGVFGVARDVTELKEAEETLKRTNEILEEKVKERTSELKERNIALKVLLDQRKKEKAQLEKTMMLNIKKLIKPNLVRLKRSPLNGRQKSELAVLEANLNEITSPFESSLSSEYLKLTPTEIQVANFIKHNATSKEIARALGLSRRTIDTHRHNIRKKIGIRKKGVNLKTYLSSIT